MAVGSMQLHNGAASHLVTNAGAQWDDASADFAWILLGAGYTQDDADTTYGDISANEIGDADYGPIAVANRSVDTDGVQAQFTSDPADFGDSVTIEAKFLGCVQGDAASLQSGDRVIGVLDLDDSGASATRSSTNDDFDISPAASGWFYLNQP